MTRCTHWWALDGETVRCCLCGVPAHASPTQLEDWRACPRKWGYRRRRHLFPVPDNVWAAFGSRAHAIREHWLKSATWTEEIAASKEGQCVAAGIEFWPRPGQALGVEIEIERLDLLGDGTPWTFKIDDIAPPSHAYDLGDLKTIGRIQYRKTVAELEADAQRVVYSVWGGATLRRDTIRAAWTYCQRSPATAIPVVFEGRVADDRMRLAVINDEARVMLRANLLSLDDLPRNRAECYRYKGHPCAYVDHCLADQNLLALDSIEAYTPDMTSPVLTLADALAAQAAGAPVPPMPGTAPALPPMPVPGPVAPPPPPKPLIVLAPELETWVQACVAAGLPEAAARAQAEAAMVGRAAPAPEPAPAPVVIAHTPQPTTAETAAALDLGGGLAPSPPAPAPAPAPARRGRPPKAATTSIPPLDHGSDIRVIAATLAARAVSGPSSPAAVVEAYHEVLALLTGE